MAVFSDKLVKAASWAGLPGMMRIILPVFLGIVVALFAPDTAWAVDDFDLDDLTSNIVDSVDLTPGLVSGLAYLLGIIFAVTGVLKLNEHAQNPTQTPLRIALVRLFIAGALFALPFVYSVLETTLNAGIDADFDPDYDTPVTKLLGILGLVSGLGGFAPNISGILENFTDSIENVPDLISAAAYLLGLVIGLNALLKAKDHIENPDQTPMREAVIRLLVAGALFALPAVFQAMEKSIAGDDSTFGLQLVSLLSFMTAYTGGFRGALGAFGSSFGSLGTTLVTLSASSLAFPAFLKAISYVIGLFLGLWGILKIRDHVLNPTQVSVWEGASRMIAAGAFFTLPVVVEAWRVSVTNPVLSGLTARAGTRYNEAVSRACEGLDGAVACMMKDLIGPTHLALNIFSLIAGMILIMIGISRLIKSAQEGARGPGGIGTLMTFIVGGVLISFNEFIRAFTVSFFIDPRTKTHAVLQFAENGGLTDAEALHITTVISAVLKFMIIVGMISFIRGLFIIRGAAEGDQQSSVMAGVTHLVGGALAVNLGPLMNAVQETIGLTAFGVAFGN